MLFHCHIPNKLPSHVLLFANMKGYKICLSFPKTCPLNHGPLSSGNLGKDHNEDAETEEQI
jgi:hypothetical protein